MYDRFTRTTDDFCCANTSVALSANSRFLIYGGEILFRRDLVLKTDVPVATNLVEFSVSENGRFIAARTWSTGASWPQQIIRVDCDTKKTNMLSVSRSGEPGNGRSHSPTISANGRHVAFLTDAQNIVEGNPAYLQQVVLRDVLLGTTTLLSATTNGLPGNDHSSRPIMSADGRTLVFQSMASDLTPGDYNKARDIFIVRLSEPDTDGDGMDDDWELTYFGNLSRDGTDDFDNDGSNDSAEFLAGTDPTNSGSRFRVMTVARVGELGRTIIWTGNPGRSYSVEYKNTLDDPGWTSLPTAIVWSGDTARADDLTATPSRFYRVVRLP